METKHTPGPWTFGGQASAAIYSKDTGEEIAKIYYKIGPLGDGFAWPDECAKAEANARLIAAAPDLLEALKFAFQDLHDEMLEHGPEGIVITHEAYMNLRAAIAKASA